MTITGESLLIIATAVVDASATPAWLARSGFTGAAPTRNGVGDYTLTVVQAVDQTHCVPIVSLVGVMPAAGEQAVAIIQTADDTFRVTTSDGTALADLDFSVLILSGGDIN